MHWTSIPQFTSKAGSKRYLMTSRWLSKLHHRLRKLLISSSERLILSNRFIQTIRHCKSHRYFGTFVIGECVSKYYLVSVAEKLYYIKQNNYFGDPPRFNIIKTFLFYWKLKICVLLYLWIVGSLLRKSIIRRPSYPLICGALEN